MRHRKSIHAPVPLFTPRVDAEAPGSAAGRHGGVCTDHSNTSTACQSSPEEAVNPTHASV